MAANVDTWIWTALADGSMVGNAADLVGMPQGRYQLTATNSMGCRYTSRIIEVPASGFRDVSYTAQRSFKATCATNNAFFDVTGFSGDTSGYRFWFTDSVTGSLLAKGTALRDLGAGTFHFRASDPQGCEKIVESFTVIALPKPVIDLSGMVVRPDHCDFAQGGISGIRLNGLAGPTAYAWTDAGGREMGNALNLGPVKSGEYTLRVTDAGTCTLVPGPITIGNQNGLLEAPGLSSTGLTIPRNTAAHIEVIRPDTGTYVLALDSAFFDVVDRNTTGSFQTAILRNDTTFFVTRLAGACRTPWVAVHVQVVDETIIYVPNAFTPNGDGLNDRLRVRVYGLADQASFVIYDRWGEKVFGTTDLGAGWDGNYKGSPGPVGTYTWYLTARDVRGAPVNRRGTVTLMR